MKIILNIIRKNLSFIFFLLFFLLGFFIHNHYGIVFDEDVQRSFGINNYNFIKNIFSNNPEKNELLNGYYGVGFELPVVFFEKFLKLKVYSEIYSFRHFSIFVTSFVGGIFFYKLLKKYLDSKYLALLGVSFLFLSPRIFAESFYNSKDIIFMFSFIICFYFGCRFLEKPTILNSLFFSIFTAWSLSIRIAAIIIPLILIYFIIIKYLRKDYSVKIFKSLFFFVIFLIIFSILFWPHLWVNPISKVINTFFIFKNYDFGINNFYLGEYNNAKVVDWHYIPVWMTVTSPVFILIFFYSGFFRIILRLVKRILKIEGENGPDLWRGKKELFNLICLAFVVLPVLLVIFFNSTLYTGWRHLYFIYPFVVSISIYEIKYLFQYFKNFKIILKIFIFFNIIFIIFWMATNHPLQGLYFNSLAGAKPQLNFDVDYWGTSNKSVIKHILEKDKGNKITVSNVSDTNLIINIKALNAVDRKRLRYVSVEDKPLYLVDNNYYFSTLRRMKQKKILNNYNVFYQLYVDNTLVSTVYKIK